MDAGRHARHIGHADLYSDRRTAQSLTAETSVTLPFVIPIITSPGNGEILPPLPGEPGIEVRGLAMPGSTIRIYENDVATTDTVTSTSGVFIAWYRPNDLSFWQNSILTARDVSQANNPARHQML